LFDSFDFEDEPYSDNKEMLSRLKEAMDSLLLKYTDKHPDVKKLSARIEKLEKKIEEKNAEQPEEKTENDSLFGENFAAVSIQKRIKENESQARQLESEIKDIEKKMEIYQKRVEDTPKREQELQALQRDYNNVNAIYDSLLDRKLEAEISVNMEKKQKGEQFRILDHARISEKPISPDVKKMFILYFGAGGGLAGAICFALFMLDSRIRTNEEIEKELGLDILAEIAPLKNKRDIFMKKLALTGFVFLSLYTLFIISCFGVLNFYGIDRTIGMIKSFL
jgi:uncharacterized protein involved in exopolysaccharide biosynthesis